MRMVVEAVVVQHNPIAEAVYDMWLSAPELFAPGTEKPKAGQFVGLYIGKGEHLLPRPLSICETDEAKRLLRLTFQTVGAGTNYLSTLSPSSRLRLLGPLGNGFIIEANRKQHWLVGGGIGVPPLLFLAKAIKECPETAGDTVIAVLGFRDKPFLAEDFHACCDHVYIATESGIAGHMGNALSLLQTKNPAGSFYACGPYGMLKALSAWARERGASLQVSMEERMACGLGACVGCAVPIQKDGGFVYRRVCKDGPVFDSREVNWT